MDLLKTLSCNFDYEKSKIKFTFPTCLMNLWLLHLFEVCQNKPICIS